MRLIDADASKQTYTADLFDTEEDFERVNDIFDYAPTVDAVPVVRCRDCKNFRRNNENDPYCADRRGLDDPEPESFCSYGEPKEKHNVQ